MRAPHWLIIAACACIVGCASLAELAPEVNEPALQYAAARDIDPAVVHRGRVVYITDCARCHSPEPVTAYSAEQWQEIMPRMCEETNLSAEDSEAVHVYVMATLAAARPE
jgi:hypothetical protein